VKPLSAPSRADQLSRVKAASTWLTRHGSGEEFSESELEAWDTWIADPANSAEYDQLMRMRWDLTQLPKLVRPTGAALLAPPPAALKLSELPLDADSQTRPRLRRPALRVTIAACVAALFAVIAVRFVLSPGSFALDSGHVYTTVAGEQHDIQLVDGSVVTLGGSSSLTVTFSLTHRTVFLDRGEARFRVQHDALRPFTVFAGLGSVTAVGTVFDVHRYSDRVFVSVSEGAVQVAPQEPAPVNVPQPSDGAAAGHWTPLRVANGQEVTYDSQGQTTDARPVDVRVSSAWADGSLVYRGRPLYEVIEDVQRYTTRHIVLDPTAGDFLYSGTLFERDVDQWLGALPKILPVEVIHSSPDLIVIRPGSAPQLDAAAARSR
jgi:transmembrane sensor